MEKKRVIKSLEKLDPEIKNLLISEYPDGFEDSLTRLTNAKNEPFFVVPLETSDTNYLIKVEVTKNDEGEYDVNINEDDFKEEAVDMEKTDEYEDDETAPYRDDPEDEDGLDEE